MIPLAVVYGQSPPTATYVSSTTNEQHAEEALQSRNQILELFKENSCAAQARQKQHANEDKIKHEFEVDGAAYL
ncbi:hypothetical protein AAC387_Pa11g2210 [Persea americana]